MSDIIAGGAELLDPLAQGASGTLWRALDLRYDRVCAAKVMRQREGADILRFVREQSVGARGSHAIGPHPHLVLPYTWAAEDDAVVLLMPLIHGGTLEQAIADHGALHPALVLELLRQLLDALSAVHAAGWVHRDVKPANLLLELTGSNAPHARLADFGIALHRDDALLTATGMVPGTPGYVAPETLRGHPASPAQDLWAAGIVALRAIAPQAGAEIQRDPCAALNGALAGRIGTLPGARELAAVLRRLLTVDPAGRGTAAQARDAIRRPTAPPPLWVLTADGEPFEVFAQIAPPPEGSPAAGRAEVPHDGPSELRADPRGLHARLAEHAHTQAPSPPAFLPAGPPPAGPGFTPAAPSTPPTAAAPARSAVPAGPEAPGPAQGTPAAAPAAASPDRPDTARAAASPAVASTTARDTSRRSRRLWPAVLLIVVAALALATAVALGLLAVRASALGPLPAAHEDTSFAAITAPLAQPAAPS